MEQVLAALDGAWRVLVTCLILGAGLPALYTVGLRQLAAANGADTAPQPGTRALHRGLATLVFAVVVLAILLGLTFITAGGLGYVVLLDPFPPPVRPK